MSMSDEGKHPLGSSWPEEEIVRRYKSASDEGSFDERSAKWQEIEAKREERLRKRSTSTVRYQAPCTRALNGSHVISDPTKVYKGGNLPDGSQKVAFYGGASVSLPATWGGSYLAEDLRAHRAERIAVKGKGYEIRIPSRPELVTIVMREIRREIRKGLPKAAPRVATGEKHVDPFARQIDKGRSVVERITVSEIELARARRAPDRETERRQYQEANKAPVRQILAF